MFSLLNPFALWLAPLIAVPLAIHFLGRTRPKLKDFPSLLPVQGRLVTAMRRHRLKNWLQLILRTLAVLALVLAAANPVWRPRDGFSPPHEAGILLHNGAYASCPLPGGSTPQIAQQTLRRMLDSLTVGHCRSEPLLADVSSRDPSARFGGYAEGLRRLLRTGAGRASVHLYLPVFDWRDLEDVAEVLRRALEENPGLRFMLTEFPEARESLSPFGGLRLSFPKDGLASLRWGLNPRAKTGQALWIAPGNTARDAVRDGDSLELRLPAPSDWLFGNLSLTSSPGTAFAYPVEAVSARVPPPTTLCHAAGPGGFASLASLGRGALRLHIQSFPDARRLLGAGRCDALYLSDPKDSDAELLGKAAEVIRRGGKVILGVGRNTDAALWNRQLLLPLRMGRLTNLEAQPRRVDVQSKACARLGWNTAAWGEPGQTKKRLSLIPDTATVTLLSAGESPILAYRSVGSGALLLWTTDVDDPEWTDLGLGPWVALAHQSFLSGSTGPVSGLSRIASDSMIRITAREDAGLRVFDPDGAPFPGLRREAAEWSVGPFDRLGLYRLENGPDTLRLAVVLAEDRRIFPATWAQGRERFLERLGDDRSRVTLRAADDGRLVYGGNRLRMPTLLLAALLLFLEGVVSLRLAPAALAARREQQV